MTPGVRKLVLTVHLAVSIGWIGAVVAYLVLGVAAVTTANAETVRAAWIAMDLTGWYAIVPLAVGSLLTGILIAFVTPWGLFRHYWVLMSFALTMFSVTILLLHMPTVSAQALAAREGDPAVLGRLGGDLFHPSAGLFILLVVTVLNVYKPRGLSPYGRRKQLALGGHSDAVSTATTPWVKTFAIVALGILLLLARCITCSAGACVTIDLLEVHLPAQLRVDRHDYSEHACGIGPKWWSTGSNSTPLS